MNDTPQTLGFIGLGQMGSQMARNLLEAGYPLLGYDLNPDALVTLAKQGGEPAESAEQIVQQCDTVLTCMVSQPLLTVAERALLPHARAGQVFVDHSTIPAPEARRLRRTRRDLPRCADQRRDRRSAGRPAPHVRRRA